MGDDKKTTLCPELGNVEPYLDDRLSPPEKHAFEQHLHGCSGCQAELDSLRQVGEVLQRAAEIPQPDLDRRAVARRLFEPGHSRKPSWLVPAYVLSAAAAAVVMAVLLWPTAMDRADPVPPPERVDPVESFTEPARVTFHAPGIRGPRRERERYVLDTGTRVELGAGQAMALRAGSRVSVVLMDGAQASTYRLPGGGTGVDLVAGVAVIRLLSPLEDRFLVRTPSGTVEATGTVFAVRVSSDSSEVWLLEGTLKITPEGEAGTNVPAPAHAVWRPHSYSPADPEDETGRSLVARAGVIDPFEAGQSLGWLSLAGDPERAQVIVEGEDIGRTPLILARGVGEFEFEIRAEGHVPRLMRLSLQEGHLVTRRFELEPEKPAGPEPAKVDGKDLTGRRHLARIRKLLAERKIEQARKQLDLYLARLPGDPQATFLLGDAYRLAGSHAEAATAYRLAGDSSEDPRLIEAARYQVGRLQLQALDKPREALATFEDLVERFPKGLLAQEISYHLVECHMALKDFTKAIGALENYLTTYPRGTKAKEARTLLEAFREKGWR